MRKSKFSNLLDIDWVLWLLMLLTVTAFALAARGPLSMFPSSAAIQRSQQLQQDPYDLQAESAASTRRHHIGTGL